MASESVENYLKCIYALEHDSEGKGVSTNAIAERMETQAPSVTDMLKKLKDRGLVDYKKYYGANLTTTGRRIAVDIIRRHRLWEVFLVEKLGFKWDEVHALAEQLEHIESDELAQRLDDFLGNPKFDPHGDPIPDQDGNIRKGLPRVGLDALKEGERGIIVGVNDSSVDFLRYLDSVKLNLGVRVEVIERFAFDQSVKIATSHGERQVSELVARNLLLRQD